MIVTLVESLGGMVLFTPKFHPELAPVESCYRDVSKTVRTANVVGTSAGENDILNLLAMSVSW